MTYRQRWGNKYGAKSTIHNGVQYHSKREAAYAAELDIRKKAGDIASWERQIPIVLMVNGQKICRYYVDFLVEYDGGRKQLVEVKGFETEVWRLKRLLLEATFLKDHPDYEYLVVK